MQGYIHMSFLVEALSFLKSQPVLHLLLANVWSPSSSRNGEPG
jgi:hypothetical protein